ncbi:MAG: sensor histidine kinase [Eubacterium sp.]
MKNREFLMPVMVGAVITLLLSAITFFINKMCGFLCLATGLSILVIFAVYTKNRYKKITELNDYLSLVCSGKYDFDIADNSEGELSILKNNLYKVIVLLRSSNDALKNDKIYLADSLADISHQLKTPLTSMMVITDLLKDETDKNKRDEFVDIIENQCEKMKWLISTLLKLSKLDAGTAEFNNTSLDIISIIDESLKPFLLTLDLKNITVKKSLADFTFIGDRNWSIEAIENIIKNCIEHTDENGELSIETSLTTLYNQIVIRDNGCGISAEDLPHIFERFYHGNNASADSVGIGLALSKTILKKQNASIAVESEEGKGTLFDIRFYKSIV